MFECPAASLPEATLPELLADPFRLQCRLPFPEGPQGLHAGLDQGRVGKNAADTTQAFIGHDLEKRVQVIFRFMAIRPATIDRTTEQRVNLDINNFHKGFPLPAGFLSAPRPPAYHDELTSSHDDMKSPGEQ